ncbi:hypothetical protein GCM10009716_19220 [Streptomyces sodiiphilus]|uniref:Carbonic anhydrase n=1 Tax=Streptomyces sodiiphilus TaxID=226217 RepID=A0ABP5ABK3_9ACTN
MPHRFATMLTCIDGRIQAPLSEWAKSHLEVDYVDTVTEPGPDSAIGSLGEEGLAALVAKVRVSQRAHGSGVLVVAGHSDCAGNPVADEEHHRQLRQAATQLAALLPDLRIIALHAGQCGEDCWLPVVVTEITPSAVTA